MTILFKEIGYLLLLYSPVGVLVLWFYLKRRKQESETVAPFEELKRRPAGESNRLRIEELNEKMDPWLMWIMTVPLVLAVLLTLTKPSLIALIVYFLLSAGVCATAYFRLRPLIHALACYRLGFHGERYVAEELNELMAEGFRVFHDVPFESYNMDHVLVGPTGIFVVETKTRRKRRRGGDKQYRVVFDGERLQFPNGWDTNAMEQIKRNRKTLSQWLSSSTGDHISAQGIITIPGWFIERSVRSTIHVMNPKEIRNLVTNSTGYRLSSAEIQRASHQLEQKCKLPV
jgi:cell division protein FtsW (lipid II flippase)